MLAAIAILAAVAAAQPPTPDAVLVAGRAWPASDRAVDVPMVPVAVAVGPAGRLYVAEFTRVWQVEASGRIAAVTAPAGGYHGVGSLAVDSAGVLYVADIGRVWRVAAGGAPTLFYQGLPNGSLSLAVDGRRNLYISDSPRARVWKVTPEGVVSPYAGTGASAQPRWNEGAISVAALAYDLYVPGRIDFDGSGNLYLSDDYWLHKIAPDGTLTHVSDRASSYALAVDAGGRIYFSRYNAVLSLDRGGAISWVAGGSGSPDGCTSDRPGFRDARRSILSGPLDLAVDSQGNLYIADAGLGKVRKVAPDFSISTVAGASKGRFGGDGGAATSADLAAPSGLALDDAGNLYIADRDNHRIRRIGRNGIIETVVGGGSAAGDDPACAPANPDYLLAPEAVAADAAGTLYIADTGHHRVLARSPEGKLTRIAGTGERGSSGDGGPAAAAQLDTPRSLAVDAAGNLWVGELFRVRRIRPDGTIETIAETGTVAADGAGNVYFGGTRLTKVTSSGDRIQGPPAEVRALAVGRDGAVYFSVNGEPLSALAADCALARIVPGAWSWGAFGGLVVSPEGDVFAAHPETNRIWKVPSRRGGVYVPQLSALTLVNGATRTPRAVYQPYNCGTKAFPVPCQRPFPATEEPAPGELVLVRGFCLAAMYRTGAPSGVSGSLPTELGGTRVWFDEVAAPLVWSQSDEVAAIVPYEIAGRKEVRLRVEYRGAAASVPVVPSAASPGWFLSYDGYAVAHNQDGSVNSKTRPAPRGTVVTAWATGEGQTDPPGVTGRRAADPLPRPILPVGVKVGEAAAEILYAGAAPGTAGILQVNFRIPAESKPGQAPLVMMVGTASASAAIWVE